MKKLTFREVINYLEAGADDPKFEQFLQHDPDGLRMLEEAKRLHALIREQAEEEDDQTSADLNRAIADMDAAKFDVEGSLAGSGVPGELFENDLGDVSMKDVMAAAKLGQRASGRVRDLGELSIIGRESGLQLSFEPVSPPHRPTSRLGEPPPKASDGSITYYQSAPSPLMDKRGGDFMDFMKGQASTEKLKIRGTGIEILAPAIQEPYESIRLNVTDTRLRIPARGLELIFMPEYGPFTRLVTDSKGVVELPMPEQPGVLRIESEIPQLLHIRIEY